MQCEYAYHIIRPNIRTGFEYFAQLDKLKCFRLCIYKSETNDPSCWEILGFACPPGLHLLVRTGLRKDIRALPFENTSPDLSVSQGIERRILFIFVDFVGAHAMASPAFCAESSKEVVYA